MSKSALFQAITASSGIMRTMILEIALRAVIEHARATGSVIYYSDLANVLKLPSRGPQLWHLLGEVSKHDVSQGLPPSSVLVVRKDSGMPGDGFFEFLTSIGVNWGVTDQDKIDYVKAQQALLYA